MKGIYVIDFGSFRKVGKSKNFESRVRALSSSYGIEPLAKWFSGETENHDEAECLALNSLSKFNIEGEKFSCSLEDCVKACVSAVSRVNDLQDCGDIDGIKVEADKMTGYINATKFLKTAEHRISVPQFLRGESVKYLNQAIVERTQMPSYFSVHGCGGCTFVHPFIFIELNRSMGAKRKVQVYQWMLEKMASIDPIKMAIERVKNAKSESDSD